jgi:hypothetical protein
VNFCFIITGLVITVLVAVLVLVSRKGIIVRVNNFEFEFNQAFIYIKLDNGWEYHKERSGNAF